MAAEEHLEIEREYGVPVEAAVLREIAVRADQPGENTFTYARLHALEESRAATLEREYPDLLAQLNPGRLDHWLDP